MGKISAQTEIFEIAASNLLTVVTPAGNRKIQAENLTSTLPMKMQDPTVLDAADGTTTSRLIYGLNVVQTADPSDYATRLPATPVKGRSVVVINNSLHKVRIYPSVAGGSLNGVVDGYVDIPADKQSYTLYCWENPLPGSWSVQLRQASLLTYPEWSIVHTNGTITHAYGTNAPTLGGYGVGSSGSNIVLTPASTEWLSLNQVATAQKLRVDTNILPADVVDNLLPNCIVAWRGQAYMVSSTGGTMGQRETCFFSKDLDPVFYPEIHEVPAGGSLSTPPEIGDTGTKFGEVAADNVGNLGDQLGLGGPFGRFYNIFGVQIPASAASKTYKFKFQIDYL